MPRERHGPIAGMVLAAGASTLRAPSGVGCDSHVTRRPLDEAARGDWPRRALADLDLPEDVVRVQGLLGGP